MQRSKVRQCGIKFSHFVDSFSIEHNFNAAAQLYTKAIELNPKDATLWANRAFTRIKLEEHGYALSDASELISRNVNNGWTSTERKIGTAIELDPKYSKAYYRCVNMTIRCTSPSDTDCSSSLLLVEQHATFRR